MRKVTLAIALAALVLFAGCNKDKETQGTTLKASIEQQKGDGSKTSLNPTNGAINWTSGDKIIVYNGTETKPFTLSAGAGSTEGTFTYAGEFNLEENIIAFYPSTATMSENLISITLPEDQTVSEAGTFANGANPMLAISYGDENLTFTNLCGVLGISLKGDNIHITGIEIVSTNENDKLNGLYECHMNWEYKELIPSSENNGTNRIMLNCNTTLNMTEAQDFFIVLPEDVLWNGFTMNVYDGGEAPIFSKTADDYYGNYHVERNTVKIMNTLNVVPTVAPTVPEGAINGKFTINANGDQVYFSKGNLQYTKSTGVWSFMEHQYDMADMSQDFGNDYANQDVVSHFGWGTSGYNHGGVCYQPWSTSTTETDYYAYGNPSYNLYDQMGNADRGFNAIANGSNSANCGWRTLTINEWKYVFNTRVTTSGIRYAKAKVVGVNGVVILPNDWNSDIYNLNNTNNNWASFNSNVISETEWNTLENVGAVFLPAAGTRSGTIILDISGSYWSSNGGGGYASRLGFSGDEIDTHFPANCSCGLSVRLVRNAE